MSKTLPILIVEDDADLRDALADTLAMAGYETLTANDGAEALEVLERRRVGLVVTDVMMPNMDGHALLGQVKLRHPWLPILLMTAYGVIDKAVEAMRLGACDYLTKPFEPERLMAAVARWMLPAGGGAGAEPVAEDRATRAVLEMADRVAATAATVLITGESGSGKEVVARYIHAHSPRAAGPFVAINCAAIPENLLEATLFGYEKGAFTGATQSQAGKFEQADKGTLFLDEIAEMPPALQAKLLRVLQEREVERVGGRKPIALDIRLLTATNKDLKAAVEAGRFREDLYYRLNVFPVHLPPLRERRADIAPLAQAFTARYGSEFGRPGIGLSPASVAELTGYGWPGNIRELENVVQRAIILATGSTIEPEHLYLPRSDPAETVAAASPAASATDIKTLERLHILETLEQAGGSRRRAAEKLGMSERTLRYKLAQWREAGLWDDPRRGGDEADTE